VPVGALHQLHSGGGVDVCQLMVQPVHPISGGWRSGVQGFDHHNLSLAPLMATRGGHFLGMGVGGGEVHH
jgi:hypothetical protein